MIYLGNYGRMQAIKCPSQQSLQTADRYSFEDTLEGVRKAQETPHGARTWTVQTSQASRPEDLSQLQMFAQGAWGPGPFWFVSTEAPLTNLLTPSASACMNPYQELVKDAGPVDLGAAGWAPRSLTRLDAGEIYAQLERVPVIQGVAVVGSAYVEGSGARVRLYWTDSNDVTLSAATSEPLTGSGFQRLHVVGSPPARATGVRLVVVGASRVTRPAITWDSLRPWSDGHGCPRAVVHDTSRSLHLATKHNVYSSMSFSVSEVG